MTRKTKQQASPPPQTVDLRQVEYVRLKHGVTRARARLLLTATPGLVPATWLEEMPRLQEAAAAAIAATRQAERTPKPVIPTSEAASG